jgi:hypothetical protein
MANPEDHREPESHWDSLNCDVVIITDADCVIDTTVRPMRDSLRIKSWDCRRSDSRLRRSGRRPTLRRTIHHHSARNQRAISAASWS